MTPDIKARFDQLEHLLLSINHAFHFWSSKIMDTAQDLQITMDNLTAEAVEAKADAARSATLTTQAVGLLQALTAKVAELAAGGVQLVTQAQLDALNTQGKAALADMAAANTQRDAADATLGTGVTDNTPV